MHELGLWRLQAVVELNPLDDNLHCTARTPQKRKGTPGALDFYLVVELWH